MSYTLLRHYPEDLQFFIHANKQLFIEFLCPRCHHPVIKEIDFADISTGFEVECENAQCKASGERYGYRLSFYPDWEESMLGLSDRPLHNDCKR